jgi:PAS domain S-box-containing protein
VDPLDIINKTDAAAFATDEAGRIVIWNRAVENLLGLPAARVLGKPCHEILCGRDVFGNRFCDTSCSLMNMAQRHEPVCHFEMELRTGVGEPLWASFSIVVVPGTRPTRRTLIHILQPVDRRREANELIRRILAGSPVPAAPLASDAPGPPPTTLSGRELEVLRLLAEGIGTQEIADSLFISVATTRNHIQNILRKLEVHSKMEAVALAFRSRLL